VTLVNKALSHCRSGAPSVKGSGFLLQSSFNACIFHQQQQRSLMYIVNPRNSQEMQETDEEEFEGK